MAVIPSTASIDAGLPPGTFSARTHLVPAPNISTQLWLGAKEPLDEVLGPFDARIRLAATRGVTGSTVAGTRDVLAASDQLRRSRGRLGLDRRDRVFVAEVEHRDDDNGNEQHAEHRERDDDAFHFDATGLDTWTTTPHEIGNACGNELAGLLCAGTGCAASQRAAAPMSCGPMR